MRIITCTGYYGTGSSAITDFISEFSNICSLSDYEFRFVQDPDGISDLEYHLVENQHYLNSVYALKRYQKMVNFLSGNYFIKKYELFFNGQWKKISNSYIEELTDLKYNGYWHQDVIDKGYLFYIWSRSKNKIVQKTIWRGLKDRNINELPRGIMLYSHPSEEKFLTCTRNYIEKLFSLINKDNKPDVMIDQIVPPTNLSRYLRYFHDIKVFIVDRDPRDIYTLEKFVWKGHVIPTQNVEDFCNWYLMTRAHREYDEFPEDKVKFVQFEDLIYNYTVTTENIMEWLGLQNENHTKKYTYLNPQKSIKNTQVWKKYSQIGQEILFIEKKLKEYLYKF